MPAIVNKKVVAKQLRNGISAIATSEKQRILDIEHELAGWLLGNPGGGRTIKSWKSPSEVPNDLDDGQFFALVWRVLGTGKLGLEWLETLLKGTQVPMYQPISPKLLRAYFEVARTFEGNLSESQINSVLETVFAKEDGGQGAMMQNACLQELVPLEPHTTRAYIENSESISILGLSLYRFLPAFQHDFIRALQNGTKLRILMVDPESSAVNMMALRSTSRTPADVQRRRIVDLYETLAHWKHQNPEVDLEYRSLDYLAPYGITTYLNRSAHQQSVCHVRLYSFQTPTSEAPSLWLNPEDSAYWFEFFAEQFEKMWAAGESVDSR